MATLLFFSPRSGSAFLPQEDASLGELIFLEDRRPQQTWLPPNIPPISCFAWQLVAFTEELGPTLFYCPDHQATAGIIQSVPEWSFVDIGGKSHAYEISLEDLIVAISHGSLPVPFVSLGAS